MKIDRYNGMVFDGKGYIKDHLACRDVIIFDFSMANDKLAKECFNICLQKLNGED